MRSPRLSGRLGALVLVALTATLPACQHPLPDAQSEGARVYLRRCTGCHAAYNPASMTAAMWQVQVEAMEAKIRQAHLPALTDSERRQILDYLTQHALR